MSQHADVLTIGRLADATGVGVETVRFYERQGLIARPRRPDRGFRNYPRDAVSRIRFIRQAQDLGFTLREIRELLSLRADPRADCAAVRRKAEARLHDVIAKAEQLSAMRRALEALIAACPGRGTTTACSILDAFEEASPPARPSPRKSSGARRRRGTDAQEER